MDLALGEAGHAAGLAQQRGEVAGRFEPSAGGSRSIIGFTNRAARSISASNSGYASSSASSSGAIEAAVRSTSLKKKIGPSSVSET